jgi:hypothetical protein
VSCEPHGARDLAQVARALLLLLVTGDAIERRHEAGKRNVWDVGLVQPTQSPIVARVVEPFQVKDRIFSWSIQCDPVNRLKRTAQYLFMRQSGLGTGTQHVD